jgi:hypothetical protein
MSTHEDVSLKVACVLNAEDLSRAVNKRNQVGENGLESQSEEISCKPLPHGRSPEQSLGVETGTTSHGEQAKRSTYNVVEAWLPIQREVAWSLS